MENTSDSFMPGPLLFCMKIERLVCYKVTDNIYRICPKCNEQHNGNCDGCSWQFAATKQGCRIYGLWSDGQFPVEKCTVVPYAVTWEYIPNLLEHLGKTAFLTKDEAEKILKGDTE